MLQRIFSLDLRSLAIFRIALGLLIIGDLLYRWSTLTEMLTGEGFYDGQLSREYYRTELGENWFQYVWSLYWISDSPEFAMALFAVAAVAAVLLVVGKWTRLATVVSWLLIVSLHVRNPLITTSGDFVFKMILFWSMFLPLGKRWSLDSRKQSTKGESHFSIASIAFIVQLFIIYFFPGIAKWNDIWLSGDAMWFVLRLDIYITEFGRAMLSYPKLLTAVSWLTLVAEVVWIWTLFSPWFNGTFRLINMAIFWMFHIGIGLSLTIGLFPWICMAAWLALVPGFCWRTAGVSVIGSEAPADPGNRFSFLRVGGQLLCGISLVVVLIWNVSNIDHPATRSLRIPLVGQLGYQLGLTQHFQMFGIPPQENPWFVYEARLADGSLIDIFRGAPVDYDRPAWGRKAFPTFHWRKLHRNALHERNEFVRQPLLDYFVSKWNRRHQPDQQIVQARLLCFREPIGPDYNDRNFTSVVWGSYRAAESPGSLFESLIDDESELGF